MAPVWECKPIDPELNKKLRNYYKGVASDFVTVGPQNYCFTEGFANDLPKFYDFEPRPTDIWVVSHPRTGTTVTLEILWLLTNNMDFETAAKVPLGERSTHLEVPSPLSHELLQCVLEKVGPDWGKWMGQLAVGAGKIPKLEKVETRRIIRTHLPFSLLNPKLLTCGAKVIILSRHPKDVVLSVHHAMAFFSFFDLQCSFEEFYEDFEKGSYLYGPFWEIFKEGWNVRDHPNVFFIFCEEMVKDVEKYVKRLTIFLDVKYNVNQLERLVGHIDPTQFANNPRVNCEYMRTSGLLKEGKTFFRPLKENPYTPELEKRVDKWVKENLEKMGISNIPFTETRS